MENELKPDNDGINELDVIAVILGTCFSIAVTLGIIKVFTLFF